MMANVKRMVLGIGAAVVAISLAGGAYVGAQNVSQAQGPGAGGPGRFGGGFGAGRGRGGPGGPGGVLGPAFGQLDLTDAQKQRVKDIVDSHRNDMQALGDRARAAHLALDTATSSATFDEATVRTKAADVATVDTDIAVMRARVFSEVYQLLTPDQQTKLKDVQAKMLQRAQDRPGRPQR